MSDDTSAPPPGIDPDSDCPRSRVRRWLGLLRLLLGVLVSLLTLLRLLGVYAAR